jgi:hypothetical protein
MAMVFAQTPDSTGGFDRNSNSVNEAATSVSEATLFANASAEASAVALTQSVLTNINLPNQFNGFASSEGQALLFGMFEIQDATGPVMTTPNASLAGIQFVMTGGTGVSASSETIFTLTLPDISPSPLLFFDNPLSIGPNQTLTLPTNQTLPMFVSLLRDTPYSFFAALDAESTGVSTAEPACFALLLTALGLSALLGRHARRGRLHRDNEPRP